MSESVDFKSLYQEILDSDGIIDLDALERKGIIRRAEVDEIPPEYLEPLKRWFQAERDRLLLQRLANIKF